MDVEIKGLDKLFDNIDEMVDDSKLEDLVEQAAQRVEADARKKAPKRTGALRRSIESKVENDGGSTISGVVFTPLEYAPYVEYGTGLFAETQGRQTPWAYQDEKGEWHTTRGQHPQPFLRPALNENREKIINSIKRGLTK